LVELRFHGRGGQGAVTSAELLALSAIDEGKYAQAFPSFGAERRGAPVQAFTRISDTPIKTRTGVYNPDMVVVLDPTLLGSVPVTQGMREDGILAINTKHDPAEVKEKLNVLGSVVTVDATNIAMEELGVPITNVVMLATLLKAKKLVELEVLEKFIAERFARIAEKEIKAFRRAYEEARVAQ